MRVAIILLVSSAIAWAASANAQTISFEELVRRVETLERENAALRTRVEQMASPPAATPVQHAPAATREPTTPVYVEHPAEPWDHAYVGTNGGYLSFRQRQRPDAIDRLLTSHGLSFGAQLGRRWQSGSLVTGLELEGNFPIDANNVTVINATRGRGPVEQLPVSEDELTARARIKGSIGFSSGSFLGYGIAGLEVSRVLFRQNSFTNAPNDRQFTTRTSEQYHPGLVFGVGAAYNLSGITFELEATRSSLGNRVARSDSVILRLNQAIP